MKELLEDLVEAWINCINWFSFIHFMSMLMTRYKTDSAFPASIKNICIIKAIYSFFMNLLIKWQRGLLKPDTQDK